MGRTAGAGRLFQRRVYLLQRRRSALHGERQITREISHKYYPYRVVEVYAEAAGPCEDNADCHNDTGNCIGQKAQQFKEHTSSGLDLDDNVRHHNAEEHTDDTGGEGQEDGVLDGVDDHGVVEEHILVVLEGEVFKGERQTVGLEEADENYHCQRHDNNDEQADIGDHQQRNFCAAKLYKHRTGGFSLDNVVAACAEYVLLQKKREHNDQNQQYGQSRTLADTLEAAGRAVEQLIYSGWQSIYIVGKAQHRGDAEVCKRGREYQKSAGRDGRGDKGNGDLADNVPLSRACDTRRLLKCRVHTFKSVDHLHINEREIVAAFNKNNAPDGVDVEEALYSEGRENPLIDVSSAGIEHQIPGHCAEEGRKHIRYGEHRFHQALGGYIAAAQQPREEQAHKRTDNGGSGGDLDGIPHCANIVYINDDLLYHGEVESAFIEKGDIEDHYNGDEDNNKEDHKTQNCEKLVETKLLSLKCRHILICGFSEFTHLLSSPLRDRNGYSGNAHPQSLLLHIHGG